MSGALDKIVREHSMNSEGEIKKRLELIRKKIQEDSEKEVELLGRKPTK